jgi:hypothetical protein
MLGFVDFAKKEFPFTAEKDMFHSRFKCFNETDKQIYRFIQWTMDISWTCIKDMLYRYHRHVHAERTQTCA